MATIFWERLLALCDEKNSTPTEQLKAAGLAAGNVTYWKNGRIPNTKIIATLEDYFGVEKGLFTNESANKKSPAMYGTELTAEESNLLEAFRLLDDDAERALILRQVSALAHEKQSRDAAGSR